MTVRGQAYGDVEPDRVRLRVGVQAGAGPLAARLAGTTGEAAVRC